MKKLIFLLSTLALLGGLLFIPSSFVFSSYEVIPENVNPGDDYKYIFKRLKEKVKLSVFKFFPKRKISFSVDLTDVRLSELKHVVDRKDIANFQTASQRYSATAGNATASLLKKGSDDEKKKFIEKLQNHIPVLVKLQEPYIPDNSEWRFLQDNINSLQSYISKLSEKSFEKN